MLSTRSDLLPEAYRTEPAPRGVSDSR
jgi:hypothetical protein